jgi:hypothetical protein
MSRYPCDLRPRARSDPIGSQDGGKRGEQVRWTVCNLRATYKRPRLASSWRKPVGPEGACPPAWNQSPAPTGDSSRRAQDAGEFALRPGGGKCPRDDQRVILARAASVVCSQLPFGGAVPGTLDDREGRDREVPRRIDGGGTSRSRPAAHPINSGHHRPGVLGTSENFYASDLPDFGIIPDGGAARRIRPAAPRGPRKPLPRHHRHHRADRPPRGPSPARMRFDKTNPPPAGRCPWNAGACVERPLRKRTHGAKALPASSSSIESEALMQEEMPLGPARVVDVLDAISGQDGRGCRGAGPAVVGSAPIRRGCPGIALAIDSNESPE